MSTGSVAVTCIKHALAVALTQLDLARGHGKRRRRGLLFRRHGREELRADRRVHRRASEATGVWVGLVDPREVGHLRGARYREHLSLGDHGLTAAEREVELRAPA